jgi:hypothetical protein
VTIGAPDGGERFVALFEHELLSAAGLEAHSLRRRPSAQASRRLDRLPAAKGW